MAAVKRPRLSLTEVSQEINLSELLGREANDIEKEAFIDEAINLIIERTQSGVDINGKSFRPYSEDYADFKGVSRGDVDMTYKGDMLLALDGMIDSDKVVLFVNDETETLKSYNHNVGDTLPKRKFFGLTPAEAELIAAKVETPSELARIAEERQFDIDEILKGIGLVSG